MSDTRVGPTYGLRQVAQKLGISHQTARALVKRGVVPGAFQITPYGPWRVRQPTFDAWIESLGASRETAA